MRIVGNDRAPDRHLISALGASLMIHSALLLIAPIFTHGERAAPTTISVQLVDLNPVSETEPVEATPPRPKLKAQKITAPKLLSKPEIFAQQTHRQSGTPKEEAKEPVEPMAQPAPLPAPGSPSGGWNSGSKPGEAEGSPAGGGNPFTFGDFAAGIGSGGTGGGGGQSLQGLGRGAKGDGAGGGVGNALSSIARPAGGYQVKPRYPESARKAGVQGTTLLKLQVLTNGKVGEVLIEKSAGHRDLDNAAAEAVKKWLFEPARAGTTPIAVWVLLPVKFELE